MKKPVSRSFPKCAEILTIGDELLKGSTLNTNARFLGRELTRLGFKVQAQVACGDSPYAIRKKLGEALSRSDIVILSGGLGPTPDDVTREGIAEFFNVPLVFSPEQYGLIKKHYYKKGRAVPALVRQEALFPQNALPLLNRVGIALGFTISSGGRWVVVLPGVPSEMERMFHDLVRPLVKRHFPGLAQKPRLTVKLAGLSEPEVMQKLGADFFEEPFDFGIYPDASEVALRLQADRAPVLRRLLAKIRKRLGPAVYALEEISLAGAVGRILARKKKTLAVAESCTGGLFAAEITQVPGASRYFKGGITAYHNHVKEDWCGVSRSLLARKGAVSPEAASALARGIRDKMKTFYGIGITGIAGPSGGSARKPVGQVYIALAAPGKNLVWKENFGGDRGQVRYRAVKKALLRLWLEIR